MQNLEIESNINNWIKVKNIVKEELSIQCESLLNDVLLACEEIFINICLYAYKKKQEIFILK